ncbi:phage virion morphogenesis protein [Dryocola sp. BD626]|uniref:phage virion morphogenesis protein n=1 Tax=Dryocola sp. BD626 TaxID=3133273 RepID=UPI003F4F80CA
MNADPLFHELDTYLAQVAKSLTPVERRILSRDVAIGLRKRQQQRINNQKNTSGESYTPRRKKSRRSQGGIKFLWHNELRELANWNTTGRGEHRSITGYDVDKGSLRTFFKRDIQRYIEINVSQVRRTSTSKEKMFRRLRTARFLKAYGTASAAVVGYSGHTAEIASVHQYGEVDNVAPGARTRYPARELLGFTESDLDWLADTIVSFLQP